MWLSFFICFIGWIGFEIFEKVKGYGSYREYKNRPYTIIYGATRDNYDYIYNNRTGAPHEYLFDGEYDSTYNERVKREAIELGREVYERRHPLNTNVDKSRLVPAYDLCEIETGKLFKITEMTRENGESKYVFSYLDASMNEILESAREISVLDYNAVRYTKIFLFNTDVDRGFDGHSSMPISLRTPDEFPWCAYYCPDDIKRLSPYLYDELSRIRTNEWTHLYPVPSGNMPKSYTQYTEEWWAKAIKRSLTAMYGDCIEEKIIERTVKYELPIKPITMKYVFYKIKENRR